MRYVRLAAVVVLMLLLQVTVFPHLRIEGVAPDLGLLVAVAVGYHDSAEAGAITGFCAGFAFDLFLETPVGLHALSYAIVGYAAGVLEGGLLRSPRWMPTLLGALGGLAGGLIFVGVGYLVGVDAVKGTQAITTISIAALYDALLAPFVFLLVVAAIGRRDERPVPTLMR